MVEISIQPVRVNRLHARLPFPDDKKSRLKSMDCKIQQSDAFYKGGIGEKTTGSAIVPAASRVRGRQINTYGTSCCVTAGGQQRPADEQALHQ
jgi:hypothetical protein